MTRMPEATARWVETVPVRLVRLSGDFDAVSVEALVEPFLDRLHHAEERLVLDLTAARLMGAAAARALAAHLRPGARRTVLLVAAPTAARAALGTSTEPGPQVFTTVEAALAALPELPSAVVRALTGTNGPELSREGLADLQQQVFGLTSKSRSREVIGMAQGIVLERYGLRSPSAAFDLLRVASQHHNVPVRILSAELVTAAPPAPGRAWFPGLTGRDENAAPHLALLAGKDLDAGDFKQVLRAVVARATTSADADAGEVHLPYAALGKALILEGHTGLEAAYRNEVAEVKDPLSLPVLVHSKAQTVHVPDLATDLNVGTSPAGRAALAAGSRALLGVPALDESRAGVGVITVHHRRPGQRLTEAQGTALEALAGELAVWLSWYRRVVVLNALEHLHTRAS
ncbi:GAF domain-containing protein [Streptomyces sp. PsTaAH-137]|nr:ANTAR domain-containing protein [Streptomyces sp. SID8367]RAJ91925.1 GAF domain-containing protein [Streptomyces sp. PsTaAH-137]